MNQAARDISGPLIFPASRALVAEALAALASYAASRAPQPLHRQEYIAELSTRLRLLDVALEMLDELIPRQLEAKEFADKMNLLNRIEIVTEACYLSAWRMREVARVLPGLKSFDPVGIRDVRNQLIQHPEKSDRVLVSSFGLHTELGPRIKPMRRALPDHGDHEPEKLVPKNRDRFFREHVDEFLISLTEKIVSYAALSVE